MLRDGTDVVEMKNQKARPVWVEVHLLVPCKYEAAGRFCYVF